MPQDDQVVPSGSHCGGVVPDVPSGVPGNLRRGIVQGNLIRQAFAVPDDIPCAVFHQDAPGLKFRQYPLACFRQLQAAALIRGQFSAYLFSRLPAAVAASLPVGEGNEKSQVQGEQHGHDDDYQ